ncbi:unnamed protein product, partial [Brassica rapa]
MTVTLTVRNDTIMFKQKNTRSMKMAILLSKGISARSHDKGSTSQTEENTIVACTKCG